MKLRSCMLYALTALPLAAGCLLAQAPGGIAGPARWLQGNFSQDPALLGSLNYNPALRCGAAGKNILFAHDHYDLRQATVFTVYQSRVTGRELPVWEMSGGFGALLLSTKSLSGDARPGKIEFARPESRASRPGENETVINTYTRRLGKKKTSSGADQDAMLRFGASATPGERFSGLIAEYILYEKILNAEEVALVESYLALKYGVTLEKDYLNSSKKVVWDRRKNRDYHHHIAGIARDDRAALYQKQGASSDDGVQPSIGLGQIARINWDNAYSLEDQQYLIWGDNGNAGAFETGGDVPDHATVLLARKWRMNVSGEKVGPTQLKIDVRDLGETGLLAERLCLVIDRSGSGDFPDDARTVVPLESLSPEGIATFSNILWDTDNSGTDGFTLGLQAPLKTENNPPSLSGTAAGVQSYELFPNPSADGHFQIRVSLEQPGDIELRVFDLQQRLISTQKGQGQSNYVLPGLIDGASGVYTVVLVTPRAEIPVKLVVEKQ